MATRALLLCGEEKAVQAVTQILDELEVSFEHSIESAFALRRLASQRFDLLIVDCDNVQSATQVFNSAQASPLNKTAIAIAIVEGKAGVPNAFRLGASLVLTKPVSLEQARNTLRTGIGMTRKDAPEVKPSASMAAAAGASASVTTTHVAPGGITPPTAAAASSAAPVTALTAPAATSVSAATPSATPVSASAPATGSTASVPAVSSSTPPTSATKSAATPASPSSPLPLRFESQKRAGVAGAISAPATGEKPATGETSASGATASEPKAALAQLMATLTPASTSSPVESAVAKTPASAPPKSDSPCATLIAEFAKPKLDAVKTKDLDELDDSAKLIAEDPFEEPPDTPQTLRNGAVPSFGGLSKHPFAGVDQRASRRKGILIAALILVLAGAGIYAAWLTQPKFRDLVVWECSNIRARVAGSHVPPGQDVAPNPQPVAAQPAPAPVPPPAQPQQSTDQAATAPSPESGAASAPASSVTSPTPAGTSESKQTESVPAKNTTPQNTKPGSAAAHTPAANPVLVPAAALTGPATVTAAESEILEVPEDYADDQVVHRVHPTYPHQARVKKLHGTVILQAIVNRQGKVDSLQLLSGDPILAQAAADAVKLWRYKPYSHNGEPAEFQTRVTVDFKLP